MYIRIRGDDEMSVTFCGHKEVSDRERVEQWLRPVCVDLIKQGADEFFLGGYGRFAFMCASALRDMKKAHPSIQLVLELPYLNSTMLTEGYDETVYPPLESVPKRFAISRRNEWMVRPRGCICDTELWRCSNNDGLCTQKNENDHPLCTFSRIASEEYMKTII